RDARRAGLRPHTHAVFPDLALDVEAGEGADDPGLQRLHVGRERPVTFKVLSMSFAELLAHEGTTREAIAKSLTPADRAECRQVITDACWRVLRESNDPAARADALEILTGMGG